MPTQKHVESQKKVPKILEIWRFWDILMILTILMLMILMISTLTFPCLFLNIHKTDAFEHQRSKPRIFPFTLDTFFLKLYESESVLAGMVGGVNKKTLQK